MMLWTILGSCSGTEPYPGRHQTSVTLEIDRKLYFFDAGENCAYTAYNMKKDLLQTRSIFISHTHMDHVGGLPHLLWNLRKISRLSAENQEQMRDRVIPVFTPNLTSFDGTWQMLLGSEGNYDTVFSVQPRLVADGVLYDDGTVTVEALHNSHMGTPEPGKPWMSYSFLIRAQDKKIFYSGDFKNLSELVPHLEGTDLLFLETGHHRACELCRELLDAQITFGRIAFFHHGLRILRNYEEELACATAVLGDRVLFTEDRTQIEL